MYLSKLKIFGFKSFAQKVEINFPENGITSVVGPNGCGKSNIMDSIRWVLGEQRAKQLRSSKMEDVIFSGTAERPPMNIAEVSLIINNDRGVLPSGFAEIQITRRAHRSGESEYLINNQDCRLKDIHNLFYDTGMGASSYSLMESRMIDLVLSDKADERRALFEETAGISKYKQQRKETLRQLDRVSVDLTRVDDNLQMALKNVSHFERQAKKAEEWHTHTNRLKELELSLNFDQFRELKEDFLGLMDKREEAERTGESLKTELTLLETQLEERKLGMSEEEEAFREAEQVVVNRGLEINTLNSEVQRLQDKVRHVEDSLGRYREEIAESEEKLNNLDSEKSQNREEIELASQDKADAELKLEVLEEQRYTLKEQHETAREQSMQASSDRMGVLEQFNLAQNSVRSKSQEIDHIISQESSGKGELETIDSELARLREELAELAEITEDSSFEEREEALEVKSAWLESYQDSLQSSQKQERALYEDIMSQKSRQQVLQQLEKSAQNSGKLHKEILNNSMGVLLDNMKANAYPDEVERCLGASSQAMLAENAESFQQSLNLLQNGGEGTVLLGLKGNIQPSFPEKLSGNRLLDDVKAEPEWLAMLESLIGNYYLAGSFAEAQNLAGETSGNYWFLSPEGTFFHSSGIVKSGKSAAAGSGSLKRRQELEELELSLPKLEEELQGIRSQMESGREEYKETQSWVRSERSELQTLRNQWQQKQQSKAVAESRLESFEDRRANLWQSLGEVREKVEPLQLELETLEEALLQKEEAKENAEAKFEEVQEFLREVEEQRSNFEEEYQLARETLSTRQNDLSRFREKLEFMDRQEFDLKELVEKRKLEIDQSAELISSSVEAREELYNKIEAENERLEMEEERRDIVKEAYDVKMGQLEEFRDKIKEVNTGIHQSSDAIHKSEIRLEGVRNKMNQIRERIFEVYEIDLEEDEFESIEYDEDQVQSELAELKLKIKKLGNINPGAFEDYEEEKARLENVQTQFDDLDRARISLEKTIRKLDKVARDRFLETFDQICRNFQDVFASLMKNGEARLTLEENVDPLEAKIEINARPTGKKMRGVTLLSGGERALTATALLFALYLVKPSPYCILDEVDGPLDDANIGRFVDLLRRFSRQTQFIVITHNKRTMAASDRLYGVTQEIKGISRIASVHLDEAASMID